MNCKNCNIEVNSKYCPNCGQPATLKRIDWQYIIHEVQHVLHLERGFLYTVGALLTKPGQAIRIDLAENRARLVKPIIFIILTSLIYTLCNHYFHFEDEYVGQLGASHSTTAAIFKWIQGHYGYANIIMGIFIALWTMLFFRRASYNFFEILILLCFVMGIGMLIYSIFNVLQGLIHVELMQIAGMAGFVYTTWAVGQFFWKERDQELPKGTCGLYTWNYNVYGGCCAYRSFDRLDPETLEQQGKQRRCGLSAVPDHFYTNTPAFATQVLHFAHGRAISAFRPDHELRIPAPKLRRPNACPPIPPSSSPSSSSLSARASPMRSPRPSPLTLPSHTPPSARTSFPPKRKSSPCATPCATSTRSTTPPSRPNSRRS